MCGWPLVDMGMITTWMHNWFTCPLAATHGKVGLIYRYMGQSSMGSSVVSSTAIANHIRSNPTNMGKMKIGGSKTHTKKHAVKKAMKKPPPEPESEAAGPTIGGSESMAPKTLAKQTKYLQEGGATAKYSLRGQNWTLRFKTKQEAGKAMGLVTTFDQRFRHFLMVGADVRKCQDGLGFSITWAREITGNSLHGWFRKNIPQMGKGGLCQFCDFWLQPVNGELLPRVLGCGGAADSYPALPPALATASFDITNWWDMAKVRTALDEHGFVCLRKFIPTHITQLARDEATRYFLEVMRSFQHGYAIDEPGLAGFDKLAALPGKVWEHRPNLPTTRIKFASASGSLGLVYNPLTKLVTKVHPWGQAHKHKVEVGWALVGTNSEELNDEMHSLASKLASKIGFNRLQPASKSASEMDTEGTNQPVVNQEVEWPAIKDTNQPAVDTSQPLVEKVAGVSPDIVGCGKTHVVFEFQPPKCYTHFAIEQHWGVATKRGYQSKNGLGMGKATDPEYMQHNPGVMATQRWMANWIAQLHQCLPGELLWEPQGVSFKAGSTILIPHMGSPGSA